MSDFPKGWTHTNLGSVCVTSQYGVNIPSTIGGKYPVLGMKNLQNGRIDENGLGYADLPDDELEKYKLQAGDLLINRTNSPDLVGKTALFDLDGDFIFASYLVRFRLNEKVIAPMYLNYFCNSKSGIDQMRRLATKGVSQANINPTELKKKFYFPLPPLPEQHKIAKILNAWDEGIVHTENLIDALRMRKSGLMHNLLTGDVRFPKYKKPWQKISIKQILSSRNEMGYQSQGFELFSLTIENGVTPKTERYNREFLVRSDDKKYKKVYPNDIVYNPANLRWGAIGKSRQEKVVLVSPIYEVLQVKNPEFYDADFAFYALSNPNQIQRFSQLGEGTLIERVAVKLDALLMTQIPVPPTLEEQIQIADVIKLCDQEIESMQKKLELMNLQKVGLMQKLLSGQIRVTV